MTRIPEVVTNSSEGLSRHASPLDIMWGFKGFRLSQSNLDGLKELLGKARHIGEVSFFIVDPTWIEVNFSTSDPETIKRITDCCRDYLGHSKYLHRVRPIRNFAFGDATVMTTVWERINDRWKSIEIADRSAPAPVFA